MSRIKYIIATVIIAFSVGVIGYLLGHSQRQDFSAKSCPDCQELSQGVFSVGAPLVYTDPDNPRPSPPVKIEDIAKKAKEYGVDPQEVIHIKAGSGRFEPSRFEVKPGQRVVLAFSSSDNRIHILKFREEILKEVALGVRREEVRLITFRAPQKEGTYNFYCDFPGHFSENGQMIVKGRKAEK